MAFTGLSLKDFLGAPPTKIPIDLTTFTSYVTPPVVCYIVAAILAVTPRTRIVRIVLCPIAAWLALRAALSVDASVGTHEPKCFNIFLAFSMVTIAAHSLSWTLAKRPLVRYIRFANGSPSTIMDALDLATNLRGLGWDWSRGLYVPRETRPSNRIAFAFYALISATAHGLVCGVLHQAIQTFASSSGSSIQGSTIFDPSIRLPARYLRSSIISILTGIAAHAGAQTNYDVFAVFGILLFGQDLSQWPPAFDSPWRSTSLSEFWGRRWHQEFRHTFLLGAYPFSVIFGRPGTIVGTFIVSGVLHHVLLFLLDDQSEMWRMLVGFGMMGFGVVAERAFYRSTGKRVGGTRGWIWTMTWLLVLGNVIVDGFLRARMFAAPSPIRHVMPVRELVDRLVIGLDAWIRTI